MPPNPIKVVDAISKYRDHLTTEIRAEDEGLRSALARLIHDVPADAAAKHGLKD